MFDLLTTVLTGGATGILGSILGKGLGVLEEWQKQKGMDKEHQRTIDLYRLQSELKIEEKEKELEIAMAQAEVNLREASYQHDQSLGRSSRWVIDTLRLVRPTLTGGLIILVGIVFFASEDLAQREAIVHSILYLSSSSCLWWFGDRAARPKK